MDPIEERDIEKLILMLDNEKVKKKVLDILFAGMKLNINISDLVSSGDFRLGIKSIITEYQQDKTEEPPTPKQEEPK